MLVLQPGDVMMDDPPEQGAGVDGVGRAPERGLDLPGEGCEGASVSGVR